MKRLWLIQAAGNAMLFWLAFTWLGIRDARNWQLAETAVFGLVILAAWLWLQDGTFTYCADRSQGLRAAFRKGLKTLAIFSAVAIVFVALCWALGKLDDPLTRLGQKTASWLTFHLRKPVKPATWVRSYLAVLWGVRWIVLPALLLPVAAGSASHGVRGVSRRTRKLFWLEYLVALLVGFYLPTVLMGWVPKLTATTAQVMSFVLRFGFAYALIITAWLAIAFFTADENMAGPVGDLPSRRIE